MSALASALVYLVLQFGPQGHLIHDQLARRDHFDRQSLPIEALYQVSRQPLYLIFHQNPDWPKAFATSAAAPALEVKGSRPGIAIARLYLYRPYYLKGGRLIDLRELAVDTGSAYYRAILELQAESRLADARLQAKAKARADLLFPEVQAEQRLQIYGETLVEFATELMSIAGQITRARRRGIDLCPKTSKAPLLEHWRRTFEEAPFYGIYTDLNHQTVFTRQALAPEDKKLAAAELLGRPRFKGDPVADLAVCAP